jgi:hypothetical protein
MIADRPTVYGVMSEIRRLSTREQLDLLEEIARLVREALPIQPTRSILELKGLGAQVWHGIRAQEYVSQERAAWDG